MIFVCVVCILLLPVSATSTDVQISQTINMGKLEPADDPTAAGLIYQYNLSISRSGNTTLLIEGTTDCDPVVVKCGFKSVKVQRRLNSTSPWADYYDYGNIYNDSYIAILGRSLTVDSGYQYRVTCKHYAKKNLFSTQTISNTSNIVTF